MPYDPFAVTPLAAPTVSTAPQPATTTVSPSLGVMSPKNALGPVFGLNGNRSLAFGQFRDARQDWRGQRPDMTDGMAPEDYRSSMMSWRGDRPTFHDYWSMGQPGSAFVPPSASGADPGNTGIVPPSLPPTNVGMVPGVPGSLGLNPGSGGPVMTPGGGGGSAPLQANDWRTLLANRVGSRF